MTAPEPTPVRRLTGRVAWADTDASGWIHFTAPQRWAEECEHLVYRSLEPAVDPGRFPRRAVQVDYALPLGAGDAFTVELWVERLGRTSISYGWRVTRDGRTCVTGRHTAVQVGDDGRPASLADHLVAALTVGD
jgi:acyl-CoA thioesterase FadM